MQIFNQDMKNFSDSRPPHWTQKAWFIGTMFLLAICLLSWIDNQDREFVKQTIAEKNQRIQQLEIQIAEVRNGE